MAQLGGNGDPAGRAKKKDGEKAGGDGAGATSGADAADQFRLTKKEVGAVLRNLGVADADIKKLRRSERMLVLRAISRRAVALGVAGSLSRFARGASGDDKRGPRCTKCGHKRTNCSCPQVPANPDEA